LLKSFALIRARLLRLRKNSDFDLVLNGRGFQPLGKLQGSKRIFPQPFQTCRRPFILRTALAAVFAIRHAAQRLNKAS
jgi:hypothetical protein